MKLRQDLGDVFYPYNWDDSIETALLDPERIAMMKHEICNWKVLNCNSITQDKIEDTLQKCQYDIFCLEIIISVLLRKCPLTVQG